MYTILVIFHIMAAVFLIAVVLLQTGKGAEIGAVFGGSSQTLFGGGGAGTFLTRVTTGVAIFFMFTSLTLGYFSPKILQVSPIKKGRGTPLPIRKTPMPMPTPIPKGGNPPANPPLKGGGLPSEKR